MAYIRDLYNTTRTDPINDAEHRHDGTSITRKRTYHCRPRLRKCCGGSQLLYDSAEQGVQRCDPDPLEPAEGGRPSTLCSSFHIGVKRHVVASPRFAL